MCEGGGRGGREAGAPLDLHVLRETTSRGTSPVWIVSNVCVSPLSLLLLFITAVPNTNLCAWGEEDSGGHVL
jgi:hypothetical protein